MRRLLALTVAVFGFIFSASARNAADSLRFSRLDVLLDEYIESMRHEPLEKQMDECDFIIGACQDSLDRQYVTVRLYDRYLNAGWMGSENVAVYILDNWVFNGRVAMYNDLDFMNAYVYAEFNRKSLIGKQAAELRLEDPSGDIIEFGWTPAYDKYRVLLFYSPTCVTCRVTVPRLTDLAEDYGDDVIFDAINVDGDRAAWQRYIADRPAFAASMMHYTIPEGETDYQTDFGVNCTPQVLLLDPYGEIIGRRLDPPALDEMLDDLLNLYEGPRWEESTEFVASLAATLGANPTPEDVLKLADSIEEGTAGDKRMYKILTAALLREYAFRRGHAAAFATDALARERVLGRLGDWPTSVDEREVVGHAEFLTAMMDLAPIGSKVPALKVHGELHRGTSVREGRFRLRRICGRDQRIVFYSPGCEHCRALLETLPETLKAHPKRRILLVNLDALSVEHPDEAQALFDAFDLSTLPMVISVGPGHTITDKYLDTL